jgi:hypothetical protein
VGRWRRAAAAPGDLEALVGAWPGVVGAAAAAKSRPSRRSRAGVLTVACAGAAWAQELAARADVIVRRLEGACPDVPVTGVRFVVADHATPAVTPPRPHARPRRPSAEQAERARRAAAQVEDPALRGLLERAVAAQLAREHDEIPAKRDLAGGG